MKKREKRMKELGKNAGNRRGLIVIGYSKLDIEKCEKV